MPKTNDFLRPFFLDFEAMRVWRVWRVWASFWLQKSIFFVFFSILQFFINFRAFWEGFGRVWGGFGEGLGGFGEGVGRVWGWFSSDFGFQNDVWGSQWSWDVQKMLGNFCSGFLTHVFQNIVKTNVFCRFLLIVTCAMETRFCLNMTFQNR